MSRTQNNRPHSLWSLCGSVVEHQSVESEGLRFASSRGLIIFSLSHACDRMKNIFLYFFTELKTYHLSYFYQHKSLTFNYELGYHWKSYEWEMSHTIWIFEFTIFLRSICELAEVASCWSGLKSAEVRYSCGHKYLLYAQQQSYYLPPLAQKTTLAPAFTRDMKNHSK